MIGRFLQQGSGDIEEPKGFDDYHLRLGDVMRGERATLGKSLLDIQRDLKIKATYVAAIENADPSVFETQGFIAGYVRSYAKYLGLDPDWAFKAFCDESGFETAHGMTQAATGKRPEVQAGRQAKDPFGEGPAVFKPRRRNPLAEIEPGAVGSVVVLAGLIGVIGYGGYAVLNEVQKVQVVPVEQAPEVIADIDPLDTVSPAGEPGAGLTGDERTALAGDRFDRLYRPQALDVPVLVARDGPISTLDPRRMGALADPTAPDPQPDTAVAALDSAAASGRFAEGIDDAVAEALGLSPGVAGDEAALVQVTDEGPAEVAMIATAESWVRVRSADGTVIYENVMQPGDTFVLPSTEEPATLRTGNAGGIYVAVGGTAYGPVGAAGAVVGDVNLAAGALTGDYEVADMAADQALARAVAELTPAAETPEP